MEQEKTLRIETIGDATLYLGDCKDILPGLGQVDAVVTDPPYGLKMHGGRIGKAKYAIESEWDNDPGDVVMIISLNVPTIIWGGNYFKVPPSKSWLVWDKETKGITTFADCELAWTNLDQSVRMIHHLWSGPYQRIKEKRCHPTQKPMRIMEWCLGFLPNSETILDPFMGSGTTGVAALNLGRKFIGIEKEAEYFEITCQRISDAERQDDFFIHGHKQEQLQLAYA
jgi:DNA modification methylase